MAKYPLPMILLAAVIARGIRYYRLALLVLLFGERGHALAPALQGVASGALLVIAAVVLGGRFLPSLFG